MLKFAAITPHPPIIIPEIGSEPDLKRAGATIEGMKKLAQEFQKSDIDTIVIVSPHAYLEPDVFNIYGAKRLRGSFADFGAPDIKFNLDNDSKLGKNILEEAQKENLPVKILEETELDHGEMVPLYYLIGDKKVKVIPITYSYLNRASHLKFGKAIGTAIGNSEKNIAFIASGDMSHRVTHEAPAGFSPEGRIFDEKIVDDIKNNRASNIIGYSDVLLDSAGECGYRSILILLGLLQGKNYDPEVLSYEAPFGVGYLVANYKLK